MIVAFPYEKDEIFQHFGHTKEFKLYEIEGDKILSEALISTEDSQHETFAALLKELHVTVLICGGIGDGAKKTLIENDIQFFGGVTGSIREALENFMLKTLDYDPNVGCNHSSDHVCSGHDHHK